ncbi:hypothetical protein FLAG1_03705 [Fusarium langsethiae]|uniref:Uncharacterized protein n=1 Tax=Fusarium langsethiae TaxID=179993 RepID=A0A0N0V7F9_FUSLA|nr:hypothetical protein FLAG1_03705 [Fusarium langsethiae]GKU00225.1 unnamed protein product [Fusarium langsethiae]GKU17882.1 unnamed protein product [Fusarium langsethiae]
MADDISFPFRGFVLMTTAEELHENKLEQAHPGLEEWLQSIINRPGLLPTMEASVGAKALDRYNLPPLYTPQTDLPCFRPINKRLRQVIDYEIGFQKSCKRAKAKKRKIEHEPLNSHKIPKLDIITSQSEPLEHPEMPNSDIASQSKSHEHSQGEPCQTIVSGDETSGPE